MWKMKAPEEETTREERKPGRGKIKGPKGWTKKKIEPIKALSEFEA